MLSSPSRSRKTKRRLRKTKRRLHEESGVAAGAEHSWQILFLAKVGQVCTEAAHRWRATTPRLDPIAHPSPSRLCLSAASASLAARALGATARSATCRIATGTTNNRVGSKIILVSQPPQLVQRRRQLADVFLSAKMTLL